jgi:hypothetical protein
VKATPAQTFPASVATAAPRKAAVATSPWAGLLDKLPNREALLGH